MSSDSYGCRSLSLSNLCETGLSYILTSLWIQEELLIVSLFSFLVFVRMKWQLLSLLHPEPETAQLIFQILYAFHFSYFSSTINQQLKYLYSNKLVLNLLYLLHIIIFLSYLFTKMHL